MTIKNTNIPTLRFAEFMDDWEMKKLGEIAYFKAGYAFKSENMLSYPNAFQLIKMSNVYQSELRLDRNASYWNKVDSKQEEFILKKGDTVLTLTGTVGKRDFGYSVKISESNKYLLNQRLVLLRQIKNKSDNNFISQLLLNERFLYYFFGEAKGGTGNQTNVSTEDVKNIELHFPTLPEQTKIANFLTAIDDKIQQLSEQKSLLEQYKKGIMQKIFSREIRFKPDTTSEYPDWDENSLGEVANINPKNEKLPISFIYIDLESVVDGRLLKEDKIEFENAPSRAQRLLQKEDILFQMVRPYQKNNLFFDKVENDYVASTGYAQLRTQNNSRYIYHLLHTDDFVNNVMLRCTGTSYPAINSSDLAMINISIPSLPEQQKIATFLTGIDEKINGVKERLEATKAYKKGLLQVMFV